MKPANSNVLTFEVPKKINSTQKHNEMHLSNADVNGTYVPNMSKEDMNRWKAKHIKGDDERVEIRKTLDGVQVLIVVYKKEYQPKYPKYPTDINKIGAYSRYQNQRNEWTKRHQNVRISMNGKLDMTWDNWWDMTEAIKEAMEVLL